MRPLHGVVWGLLLVALDFRIGDFDVLPDPAGWLLAALGMMDLVRANVPGRGWFNAAGVVAVLAVVVSVPDMLGDPPDLVSFVLAVLSTAFVFATCTGVMAAVPAKTGPANLIRWADLGLAAVMMAAVGAALVDDSLKPLVLIPGIGGFLFFIYFLVVLTQTGKLPVGAAEDVGVAH